jgi:hypothetical protein
VAIRATLTLPGIAGIALGIGMAVDSNVLILERIREMKLARASGRPSTLATTRRSQPSWTRTSPRSSQRWPSSCSGRVPSKGSP